MELVLTEGKGSHLMGLCLELLVKLGLASFRDKAGDQVCGVDGDEHNRGYGEQSTQLGRVSTIASVVDPNRVPVNVDATQLVQNCVKRFTN